MTAIACVDRNWAIGHRNRLLFDLPGDLAHFKALTMGHVLLMGRKTYESLPKALIGREIVVLSRGDDLVERIAQAKKLGQVFVAGGGEVYRALLPYCKTALITQVNAAAPEADAYFPNLDQDANWALTESGDWLEENELRYRFCKYHRK